MRIYKETQLDLFSAPAYKPVLSQVEGAIHYTSVPFTHTYVVSPTANCSCTCRMKKKRAFSVCLGHQKEKAFFKSDNKVVKMTATKPIINYIFTILSK